MLLNFGGRKRSGVFNTVWPSAKNTSERSHKQQARPTATATATLEPRGLHGFLLPVGAPSEVQEQEQKQEQEQAQERGREQEQQEEQEEEQEQHQEEGGGGVG